jgi:hypothetical protein
MDKIPSDAYVNWSIWLLSLTSCVAPVVIEPEVVTQSNRWSGAWRYLQTWSYVWLRTMKTLPPGADQPLDSLTCIIWCNDPLNKLRFISTPSTPKLSSWPLLLAAWCFFSFLSTARGNYISSLLYVQVFFLLILIFWHNGNIIKDDTKFLWGQNPEINSALRRIFFTKMSCCSRRE